MFYSHEILSNSQYGVATIWLVATVGKGASRKLTRKAIQEVNLPKACGTIIEPGAPLALRLQGNLLYGTARVYAQQCNYILHDAEKTQSDMMTFFRVHQMSEQDPKAGKTKRKNIVLDDDASFDPFAALPALEFPQPQEESAHRYSQNSAGKFSQLSPHTLSDHSSSRQASLLPFDIPPSSRSAQSYRLPSELGFQVTPTGKQASQSDTMNEFRPFMQDDGFEGLDLDLGLNFDGDGNLIETLDPEPELPQLPRATDTVRELTPRYQAESLQSQRNVEEEDVLIFDEPLLPDAEAFAVQHPKPCVEADVMEIKKNGAEEAQSRASAKNKRGRPRNKAKPAWMVPDQVDRISRDEFRDWDTNYMETMMKGRQKRDQPSLVELKERAWWLLVGRGIGNIGAWGPNHPLADFAGERFASRLRGENPDAVEEQQEVGKSSKKARGRRRTSSEAFSDDEEGRRVKQKASAEAEGGRALAVQEDEMVVFDDDTAPEIGLEPMTAMAERHSSSLMPWSRPGSAVPGSSVRSGKRPAATTIAPSSPLHNRGKHLPSIERESDPVVPSSDDFGHFLPAQTQGSEDTLGHFDANLNFDTGLGDVAALDAASQDFLAYAVDHAREVGPRGAAAGQRGTWIDFEELAMPGHHDKAVAAQAFLHVLSLATKNVIAVAQDGAEDLVPFGKIRVGVPDVATAKGDASPQPAV